MVAKKARLTAPEIAEKYGREVSTVAHTWRNHPDWPPAAGRRGRWAEYDAQAVDDVVRTHLLRPAPRPRGRPDDLLTIAQIADYVGLARGTIDSDISRGRWRRPDDTRHGVKRWRRATVDAIMEGRRAYRRTRKSC